MNNAITETCIKKFLARIPKGEDRLVGIIDASIILHEMDLDIVYDLAANKKLPCVWHPHPIGFKFPAKRLYECRNLILIALLGLGIFLN